MAEDCIILSVKRRRRTDHLITESINPRTKDIDKNSTIQIIELISEEDQKIADAVSKQKKEIAKAVDLIVDRLRRKGRLIFVGAGTSGRLGMMEAAECPPTFGTNRSHIEGVMAGGKRTCRRPAGLGGDSSHSGGA